MIFNWFNKKPFGEKQKVAPDKTAGLYGFDVSGGYQEGLAYIIDEFLRDLEGTKGRRVYREMRDNDPIIGSIMTAISLTMTSARWRVVSPIDNEEDEQFIKSALFNQRFGFNTFIQSFSDVLLFGFGVYEVILKKDDLGRYTLKQLAPRLQETIYEWDLDEDFNVVGVWQQPRTVIGKYYIPAEKILHLRSNFNRGNPEGKSIIRNAYKSYYYIKALQQVEAIAAERELNGLPVLYAPSAVTNDSQMVTKLTQIVRDVKFNEQGGIVFPSDTYVDADGNPTNVKKYELQLLASEGSRNIDVSATIRRHQQDIYMSTLTDILLMGNDGVGTYSLAKEKGKLLNYAVKNFLDNICDAINEQVIRKIWTLNGYDQDTCPKLTYDDVDDIDIAELGDFVRNISGAGVILGGDDDVENALRDKAGLPKKEGTVDGLE